MCPNTDNVINNANILYAMSIHYIHLLLRVTHSFAHAEIDQLIVTSWCGNQIAFMIERWDKSQPLLGFSWQKVRVV